MDSPHAGQSAYRRLTALSALIGLGLIGALAIAPIASSATVTNAWQAKIGTAGANGTAKIQAFATGTGSVTLKIAKLWRSTLLPVSLSKGTCSAVGATLIRLPSIRTTSTGAASRTSSLTAAQVRAIKAATRGTGRIAIRVGTRATGVKCGVFSTLSVVTPTPSPTPNPSPSGGTLYVGPDYMLGVPTGWVLSNQEPKPATSVVFSGPGGRLLLANSIMTTLTLDELVAQITVGTPSMTSELVETVTMSGVPGRLFAYHFTSASGAARYEIDAFAVTGTHGYELSFTNVAGTEADDLAFFRAELGEFTFLASGF